MTTKKQTKEIIFHLIILTIILVVIIYTIYFVADYYDSPRFFSEICQVNNGSFFITQNVTCAVNYPNCMYNCDLRNGTIVNYYEREKLPFNMT